MPRLLIVVSIIVISIILFLYSLFAIFCSQPARPAKPVCVDPRELPSYKKSGAHLYEQWFYLCFYFIVSIMNIFSPFFVCVTMRW